MTSTLMPSLEQLLASGGDSRLDLDPATGRNRYACESHPSVAIPFGSCTSSTVSERGLAAAAAAAQRIRTAADPRAAARELATDIRIQLRRLLKLGDQVDIALAPSGTDTELLALALAAGDSDRPIVNILVGPNEVGSGTPLAAAVRHYDARTPSGAASTVGEAIDPKLAARAKVKTVDLRSSRGDMLSEPEIDATVIELFLEACDDDALVLLHIVAHSKTGVHAPSLACLERLRRTSDDVAIVIDAAQGRFSRRGLREALQNDYLVMLTGSKFFGGPPFSGALLVPPRFHPGRRGLHKLAAGFQSYFTAADLPESWSHIRNALGGDANIGLLLRWTAAIAEMDAYYRVPSDSRLRVLRFFETEVPKILGESSIIRLLPVFPPLYDDSSHRLLESKTTVFGFWITPPGASTPLGKAELKDIQFNLAADVSAEWQDSKCTIMSRQFHVGQPVDLGESGYILRVALGGALITQVATDTSIGCQLEERLEWLREQLRALRKKIECLATRYSPNQFQHGVPVASSAGCSESANMGLDLLPIGQIMSAPAV